jgi:hypothetical protein
MATTVIPTTKQGRSSVTHYRDVLVVSGDYSLTVDLHLPDDLDGPYPVILFSHDSLACLAWQSLAQIGDWFAAHGFCFVRFRSSGPDNQEVFSRAGDTLSSALDHLGVVLDRVLSDAFLYGGRMDKHQVFLLGHGRGGGLSILKAVEDARICKLVTWGGVSDFGKKWNADYVKKWKTEGSAILPERPSVSLGFGVYTDYQAHLDRLYLPAAVLKLKTPLLAIHGRCDETVCVRAAYEMTDWNKDCAELYVIEDADHVFGSLHPGREGIVSPYLKEALDKTLNFLLN